MQTSCVRGTDVTIAACGVEVAQALAAAGCSRRKVSAEVDHITIKPLDEESFWHLPRRPVMW